MVFRLAPVVATPLVCLFFLFAACGSPIFAQEARHIFPPASGENRDARGCRLIGIEISSDPEMEARRFFATDSFHWMEAYIDYAAQRENGRINSTLHLTQRYDFVQTECDSEALELYDSR